MSEVGMALAEMADQIGLECRILPLDNMRGRIDGVGMFSSGKPKYNVDFYKDADRKTLWFRRDEIEVNP